jgi:hypothetical protein
MQSHPAWLRAIVDSPFPQRSFVSKFQANLVAVQGRTFIDVLQETYIPMAEQKTSSREPGPVGVGLDLGTGIGVVINIGHKCSHLTTSNSATGSQTRNFHLMDGAGGNNNHMGNDSHDDSTAISGTSKGTHCC